MYLLKMNTLILASIIWKTYFCLFLYPILGSTTQQNELPTIRWGQSSKKLTLVISISSVEGEKVEFTESNIHLTASNKQGQNFELNLDLLRPINPKKCSYTLSDDSLKMKIEKTVKEPCWKRLIKENKKVNFLIRDKKLGDPNDCEEAKEVWLGEYMFFKRKHKSNNSLSKVADEDPNKKKDINIIDNLKDAHPNFSLHEF
ncbi:conserved Plasmodium protein, unknown function [Plasmodium gonderi]|uniref:CS domain-containing protein n=1 Tax=Plasmodium gonderi TaxID=77519 RepID=A0A1Y1JVE8_PLAGO|nr:conserved Plasmodium protein, unknown function [Plasmodium gonderi]GAW83874.1 conserved Plasmodium protein, unknown function [Plasmodium gonderi]